MKPIEAKFIFVLLVACIFAGCGGGDSGYVNDPDTVVINNFQVYGNDTPVDGQAQVVAAINNGDFQLDQDFDAVYSGDAQIWVSDQQDIGSTDLEQLIVDLQCENYPFCNFSMTISCTFNIANQVRCAVAGGVARPNQATFPTADITLLLDGDQTDLFIVIVADAPGLERARRSVPVTFRYE